MSQIPEGAVARLTMVNGNLGSLAQIASILESFNYEEDELNPERWNLRWEHPADADAALHILQEGEAIDVYSESPENMLNVNHIATRFGWVDCEIYSINPTIEQMLMSRTANLNVVRCITGDEPESLPLDAYSGEEEQPTMEELPFDNLLHEDAGDINGQLLQVQQLTLQLNDAELRAAQLEDERNAARQQLASLEHEISVLRKAGSSAPMPPPPQGESGRSAGSAITAPLDADHGSLLGVLERHLSSIIDLSSATESPLAKDLLNHGYNMQVRLVKA